MKRGLHADVPLPWFAQNNLPTPSNVCFMVNAIWMLTEFTRDNGATLLLPYSHRFGHVCNKWVDSTSGELRYENESIRRYRTELESEGDPRLVAAEGPPGSLRRLPRLHLAQPRSQHHDGLEPARRLSRFYPGLARSRLHCLG